MHTASVRQAVQNMGAAAAAAAAAAATGDLLQHRPRRQVSGRARMGWFTTLTRDLRGQKKQIEFSTPKFILTLIKMLAVGKSEANFSIIS